MKRFGIISIFLLFTLLVICIIPELGFGNTLKSNNDLGLDATDVMVPTLDSFKDPRELVYAWRIVIAWSKVNM